VTIRPFLVYGPWSYLCPRWVPESSKILALGTTRVSFVALLLHMCKEVFALRRRGLVGSLRGVLRGMVEGFAQAADAYFRRVGVREENWEPASWGVGWGPGRRPVVICRSGQAGNGVGSCS